MKQLSQNQSYKDPVCGMEISPMTAIEVYNYKRKTYYFCAAVCREAFEADPGKYRHHHRQHGVNPRGRQEVPQRADTVNDQLEERE